MFFDDKTKLQMTILDTADFFGFSVSQRVLDMYLDALSDLEPAKVILAYENYRKQKGSNRFPMPGDIRAIVEAKVDAKDKAREVAGRIIGAVKLYGYTNSAQARLRIGDDGWEIIREMGGWTRLCEELGEVLDEGVFQAQIRDRLEARFKYGTKNLENEILSSGEERLSISEREKNSAQGLVPLGDILGRVVKTVHPGEKPS